MVSSSLRWRWTALLLVIINAIHGFSLQRLHPSLPTIAEVSARHESLFTPAGYAFAIWGLIYAGLTAFCIYTVRPSQKSQPAHDRLARGLVVYALLGMVWEEVFIREHVGLSVIIIGAMFVTGALMFGQAKLCLWNGVARAPLYAPFSLFFGWISVATLANFLSWLQSMNWDGGIWGEARWTSVLIGAAVLLGVIVSKVWRDSIYPLVILWSLVAIWIKQRHTSDLVGHVALAGAMLITLWTLIIAGWLRTHTIEARNFQRQSQHSATT